jgi:tetratricopeptide (TPR) repeat protein
MAQHPAFQDDFDWPSMPKRSQEEIDADVEYFINHPIAAKKITPDMMQRPEFQALSELLHDGTPDEVSANFMKNGYEFLNKVVLKESKNQTTDIEQAIYCFDEGIEYRKDIKDKNILYQLLMGRAKTNILIAQFGRVKEDCLDALKLIETEQAYTLLAKSRMLLEKYREAIEYCEKGLKKIPDSKAIKAIFDKAREEEKKENKRIDEVSTMQALAKDKKLSVYRNLRGKKIKLGK